MTRIADDFSSIKRGLDKIEGRELQTVTLQYAPVVRAPTIQEMLKAASKDMIDWFNAQHGFVGIDSSDAGLGFYALEPADFRLLDSQTGRWTSP